MIRRLILFDWLTFALFPMLLGIITIVFWWEITSPIYFVFDDWVIFRIASQETIDFNKLLPTADYIRYLPKVLVTKPLVQLVGLDLEAHRAFLLLLHWINGSIIFIFIHRFITARKLVALIPSLIFLLHPVIAFRPLTWSSLINDLLVIPFFFITLTSYIYAVSKNSRYWYVFYLASLLGMMLALKTKESQLTLILVLGLYSVLCGNLADATYLRTGRIFVLKYWDWQRIRRDIFLLGSLSIVAIIFYLSQTFLSHDNPEHPYFVSGNLEVIARSYATYFSQLLFSINPSGIFFELSFVNVIYVGLAAVFPFMILFAKNQSSDVALSGGVLKANHIGLWGWIIFMIGLLPTAILPNQYYSAYYIYVPLIGICIAIASILQRFSMRSIYVLLLTTVLVLFVQRDALIQSDQYRWYQTELTANTYRIIEQVDNAVTSARSEQDDDAITLLIFVERHRLPFLGVSNLDSQFMLEKSIDGITAIVEDVNTSPCTRLMQLSSDFDLVLVQEGLVISKLTCDDEST